MSAKMTPGPWRATSAQYHEATVDAPRQGRIGQRFTMATVGGFTDEEAEANARAIACLPDLVVETRNLLKILDGLGVLTPERQGLRRVLARIDGGD